MGARIIAETHYQLGVAQGFHAQHDDAVTSLQDAITIIKERMENQKKLDTEEAKKEVKELEALIPEIEEKINDTKDKEGSRGQEGGGNQRQRRRLHRVKQGCRGEASLQQRRQEEGRGGGHLQQEACSGD